MLSSSDQRSNNNTLNRFLENISSYDGNVLLAAVVSLFLVVLFLLLLHTYAKWFLAQARQRRSSSISFSHVLRPSHFHHFQSFTLDTSSNNNNASISSSSSRGIDASIIGSIPLFVYSSIEYKQGLECVICLTSFEDGDVGRSLPKCGHGFHVECIDMWLRSHSNCPICRAPVVCEKNYDTVNFEENDVSNPTEAVGLELLEIVVDGGESRSERVSDVYNSENNRQDDMESTSSSSSSSLGCSLKRMLSRNRSDCKVSPSSTAVVNDFDC